MTERYAVVVPEFDVAEIFNDRDKALQFAENQVIEHGRREVEVFQGLGVMKIQAALTNSLVKSQKRRPKRKNGKNGTNGKNIRQCIAPKCKQPSKGPRFRFLCENHLDAGKRQIAKWKAAQAEA